MTKGPGESTKPRRRIAREAGSGRNILVSNNAPRGSGGGSSRVQRNLGNYSNARANTRRRILNRRNGA